MTESWYICEKSLETCICLWPEFDCPEVTLRGWQDIQIQLLLLVLLTLHHLLLLSLSLVPFCLTLDCLSVCLSYNPSVCLSPTLSFSPCVFACVCAWVCNSFLLLFCRFRVQTILPGQMNIKIGSVNARVHVTEVVDEVRDVSTAETGMRKGLNRSAVYEFVNNWMHKLGWLRNE